MVLNPAYTLPRYCEISCWFSDAVATAVITSVRAGSRNADAGVVATSITACRALLAGPPIDVAAAENEAGMVTTAAYRPDCKPDAASSPFVSTQVKFVASASVSASCVDDVVVRLGGGARGARVGSGARVGGGVRVTAGARVARGIRRASAADESGGELPAERHGRPFTVTGSSSLTIAAVTRSRCAVGVASAHVRMPPMSRGTASRPITASHPR